MFGCFFRFSSSMMIRMRFFRGFTCWLNPILGGPWRPCWLLSLIAVETWADHISPRTAGKHKSDSSQEDFKIRQDTSMHQKSHGACHILGSATQETAISCWLNLSHSPGNLSIMVSFESFSVVGQKPSKKRLTSIRWPWFIGWIPFSILKTQWSWCIYLSLSHLVGGLEHLLFFHILGI